MKKEEYFCDIEDCDNKVPENNNHKQTPIQVIFTTEQTEGRMVKPYLQGVRIDICEDCLNKVLTGQAVWAHGAQGHNTYYFKKS